MVLLSWVQAIMVFAFRLHATDFGGTAAGGLLLGGGVVVALFSVKPVLACVDPQAWVKAFMFHVDQHGREGHGSPFLFTKAFGWLQGGPKPRLAFERFADFDCMYD